MTQQRFIEICLIGAICALPLKLSAQQPAAEQPRASNQGSNAQQHQQHRRGPKQLMLTNADGAAIKLWKPDLSTLPMEADMGRLTLPSTGMGNYHAVVVEKEWTDSKEAIVRYEYLRGEPSDHSPTELAAAEKTDLEIVPDPIPREHYRYYSDQTWNFILRFQGRPLANQKVVLRTSNGSRVEGLSDDKGRAQFHLPDDFPNVIQGERERRSAEFLLTTEYTQDGKSYHSTLSANYHLNHKHWQSLTLGIAVAGLGLLAGGFLGRVKPEEART